MPDSQPGRRWPGDATAVIVLLLLPVLVYGVPALLGHPVLPGDDLTQNFPLRVLAGHEIRSGQLPLYDPYIWSGAPLLGGWNAGAAYPLTLLFAVAPPAAAWTLNMIATWAVAGLGMFAFLRALRLACLPGLLGALSFAFAGAMSAQVAHFGLVAGMSWVPVQLLCVLRLTQPRAAGSRLAWTGGLAAAFGLTILAGEPRAVDDAGVIVALYAAWQIARLGRRFGPGAPVRCGRPGPGRLPRGGAVAARPGRRGLVPARRELGGPVQLGLAAAPVAAADAGAGPAGRLRLLRPAGLLRQLQPGRGDGLRRHRCRWWPRSPSSGGPGSRPRPPEWLVWHIMALAGIVLALGGNPRRGRAGPSAAAARPAAAEPEHPGHGPGAGRAAGVLGRPPVPERHRRFLRVRGRRGTDPETVLGVLPPLAMLAVVALGLCWGAGLLHWLGAGPGATSLDGLLQPWLVPYGLLGGGSRRFVIAGGACGRGCPLAAGWPVSCWLTWSCSRCSAWSRSCLAWAAVLPGPWPRPGSRPRPAGPALRTRGPGPRARTPAARPIAALGYPGRFAVYDPDELDGSELSRLGAPDLNVISRAPSVQGYSSIVDGSYATATGSHQATGDGQDVLDPRAVGSGVLGQLDTSVLLTLPAYLATRPAGSAAPPGPPGTGDRDIVAHRPGHLVFRAGPWP